MMRKQIDSKLLDELKPIIEKHLELLAIYNYKAEQFLNSKEYLYNLCYKNKHRNFWLLDHEDENEFDNSSAEYKKSFKALLNSEFIVWLHKQKNFNDAKKRMAKARKKGQKNCTDIVLSDLSAVQSPEDYRKLMLLENICAKVYGFIIFNKEIIINGRAVTSQKLKKMQGYAKKLLMQLRESLVFPVALKQEHLVRLLDELMSIQYEDIHIKHAKRSHALILRHSMMQEFISELIKVGWCRMTNSAIADISIGLCQIVFPDTMDRSEANKMTKKLNNEFHSKAYNPASYIVDLMDSFMSVGVVGYTNNSIITSKSKTF